MPRSWQRESWCPQCKRRAPREHGRRSEAYCSAACKQKAYRRRQRYAGGTSRDGNGSPASANGNALPAGSGQTAGVTPRGR